MSRDFSGTTRGYGTPPPPPGGPGLPDSPPPAPPRLRLQGFPPQGPPQGPPAGSGNQPQDLNAIIQALGGDPVSAGDASWLTGPFPGQSPAGPGPGPARPPGFAPGGTGPPLYQNDAERGNLSGYQFGQRFTPGVRPEDINLADLHRYLQYGTTTGADQGHPDAIAARQNSLQMLMGLGQQAGALRTQAGDLGLRAIGTLGMPQGQMQGVLGGSLQNDASRVQMDRERHADTLSRQTRIDQAVLQYAQTNPQATQEDMARYRQALEQSIPAVNPLVAAVQGGAPGGLPGISSAYQGAGQGAGVLGGMPGATGIDPRLGYRPPSPRPWEANAQRLDQAWNQVLGRYGTPAPPGSAPGTPRSLPDVATAAGRTTTYNAIADLVSGLGRDFVNQHIQDLHPYLIHRLGGPVMNDFFTARSGDRNHDPARQLLIDSLNRRGAQIGQSALNTESTGYQRFNPANWVRSGISALGSLLGVD